MGRRPASGDTILPPPPPFGLYGRPLCPPAGLLLLLCPDSWWSLFPFGVDVSLLAMSANDQIRGLLITFVVLVEAPADASASPAWWCCCCRAWWWCRRASAG